MLALNSAHDAREHAYANTIKGSLRLNQELSNASPSTSVSGNSKQPSALLAGRLTAISPPNPPGSSDPRPTSIPKSSSPPTAQNASPAGELAQIQRALQLYRSRSCSTKPIEPAQTGSFPPQLTLVAEPAEPPAAATPDHQRFGLHISMEALRSTQLRELLSANDSL